MGVLNRTKQASANLAKNAMDQPVKPSPAKPPLMGKSSIFRPAIPDLQPNTTLLVYCMYGKPDDKEESGDEAAIEASAIEGRSNLDNGSEVPTEMRFISDCIELRNLLKDVALDQQWLLCPRFKNRNPWKHDYEDSSFFEPSFSVTEHWDATQLGKESIPLVTVVERQEKLEEEARLVKKFRAMIEHRDKTRLVQEPVPLETVVETKKRPAEERLLRELRETGPSPADKDRLEREARIDEEIRAVKARGDPPMLECCEVDGIRLADPSLKTLVVGARKASDETKRLLVLVVGDVPIPEKTKDLVTENLRVPKAKEMRLLKDPPPCTIGRLAINENMHFMAVSAYYTSIADTADTEGSPTWPLHGDATSPLHGDESSDFDSE